MSLVKIANTVTIASLCSGVFNVVHAENLLDVYQLSLENDPQYQIAIYSYESTLEVRSQARAAFLPQISAGGSVGLYDFNNDFDDTYGNNNYSLTLGQTLYNRANQIQSEQADLSVAKAQAELSSADQDLIFRTANAYFDVLSAQENLKFARSEKTAIEQQLEQAERRFEVGLIAITDVKEAQSAFDLSIANEIAAENELANAIEALRVMTGLPIVNFDSLREDSPLIPPQPMDIEEWVKTAETSNLALRVEEYSAEIANKQIESARSGHYPTISAGGSYGNTHQNGGSGDSESGALQLSLNVPLYSGGLVSSQTRQAKSQAKLAAEQYELARRNTAQQTRNTYRGVIASISRVKALEQALQSIQIAADAIETGFEVGTRTAVDVLAALRETFRAKADYSDARYAYILNTLALKQSSGTLTPNDLKAVNDWLISK